MLWKDAKAFQLLVYDLLYPGVLGSMIFDLFDPVRAPTETTASLLIIAIIFALDYLHMRFNIEATHSHNARPLIDAMIAFAFCFGYFALAATTNDQFNREYLRYYEVACFGFLLMGTLLANYYQGWSTASTKNKWIMAAAIAACLLALVVRWLLPISSDDEFWGRPAHRWWMILLTSIIGLTYGVYVLFVAKKTELRPHPPKGEDYFVTLICVVAFALWIFLAPGRHSTPNHHESNSNSLEAVETND